MTGATAGLHVIRRDGGEVALRGEAGLSVMQILRDNGIDELEALCGGCRSCATCHVYVDEPHLGRLPPISPDEDELLDGSERRQANSRLSCQLPFSDALEGITVTVAEPG